MSSGLPAFDNTIQESNLWLKDIEGRLGDCERQEAYVALRAVLHALRDRLMAQTAVNLSAQFPLLVRGIYFEGWTLPESPNRSRTLAEFANEVRAALPPRYKFDPIMICKAVFATLMKFTSAGEAEKIMAQLPEPVRELWPDRAHL